MERSLPVVQRLRWAVQADYSARRIHRHDLTGIRTPADNEAGPEHARRHLVPPPRTAPPAARDPNG